MMVCLQIYRELLMFATFLWVHSNSKEVSYDSYRNTYPNKKTTYHIIKLKLFLWTKLLENLFLEKYLISVAATLAHCKPLRDTCITAYRWVSESVNLHFEGHTTHIWKTMLVIWQEYTNCFCYSEKTKQRKNDISTIFQCH